MAKTALDLALEAGRTFSRRVCKAMGAPMEAIPTPWALVQLKLYAKEADMWVDNYAAKIDAAAAAGEETLLDFFRAQVPGRSLNEAQARELVNRFRKPGNPRTRKLLGKGSTVSSTVRGWRDDGGIA